MFEKEIYGGNSLDRPLGDLPSRPSFIVIDIYKVNGTHEEMEMEEHNKGVLSRCEYSLFHWLTP